MLVQLANEAATLELGRRIACLCPTQQFTIHLEGELGAGKTTLSRGLLQALGHQGHVKSPTYTLVEHYQLASRPVFHFDLYRVSDPEELDYLGLDDYLSDHALCIIEWPQRGLAYLPKADLSITLSYQNNGRLAELSSSSPSGNLICQNLEQ